MGNYCCNNKDDDKNALNYGGQSGQPKQMDSNLNELLEHAKKNEQAIIKIQSGFRGHIVRRHKMNDEGGSRPS